MLRSVTVIMMALLLLAHGSVESWAAPAGKGRPVRTKPDEALTLDDYERETEGEKQTASPRKNKAFASHTEINLGGGLTFGSWGADRGNSALVTVGIQQLLIPAPGYVTVGLNTTMSPATPRNFMLSATLGGGVMHVKSTTAPFAGFRLSATRLVASGRGRAFGMSMGPEIGFFPFHVGKCPISMRAQYNWMASRVGGSQPRWATLVFGVVF